MRVNTPSWVRAPWRSRRWLAVTALRVSRTDSASSRGRLSQYERGIPRTFVAMKLVMRLLVTGAILYSRVSRNLRSTS